jgi:hypothetical protein
MAAECWPPVAGWLDSLRRRRGLPSRPINGFSSKDLQLIDVSKQNRDDIFGIWGVPLSTRGISTPAGLNADRSESDEAAIWETIKERAEPMREKIQFELLDRWQALGVKVTLIFDYPEFDDDTPRYESASKSVNVAITNDERRAILGLEPLDDKELGKAIYIDQRLVRIDEEPTAEPIAQLPPSTGPLPGVATDEEEEVIEAKADLRKPLLGLRAQTETTWEPKVRRVVSQVLAEQRRYIASRSEHIARKPSDISSWWNDKREHRRFMVALEPTIVDMAAEVARRTTRTVKKPEGKADTWLEKVIEAVRTSVGSRITGINQTTREKVQAAIAEGVELGESSADLGLRIRGSAAFDDYRSELISRTETAQVYNDAALRSFGELEVTEVEAIDGDTDAECAARNGKRYPLEEALGITDHPNGTLDWVPVVKAVIPPDPMLVMAEAMKASMERPPSQTNITMPEQPAPVVTYTAPDIHVAAPEVDTEPFAKALLELQATLTKPRKQLILRDEAGRIIGIEETA